MEQKSSMKETKMGNQGSSFINDPLFYGKVNMDPSEKAQLNSGDQVCHSFMQNKTNVPLKVFNFALNLARGCPRFFADYSAKLQGFRELWRATRFPKHHTALEHSVRFIQDFCYFKKEKDTLSFSFEITKVLNKMYMVFYSGH